MRAFLVFALLTLLVACAPPPEDAPLEIETVDVGGPVDAGLSTENDEKGKPSGDTGCAHRARVSRRADRDESMTNVGGGQAHDNMQPYLVLNFCIALRGLFPSRN